jgi:hypothetical protein
LVNFLNFSPGATGDVMGAGLQGDQVREREATVNVERGLFLLRYDAGSETGRSPMAIARPARGSEPFIEVISAPGAIVGYLGGPGACAVVRAEQAGKLSVRIRASEPDATLDAAFRLEALGASANVSARTIVRSPERGGERSGGLRLLAHVARRGDIEVHAGAWVAGPDAPAAIEGLELRGGTPDGVSIELQPLVATNPVRWLDWAPHGAFIGTRGRALPLAGLRLRLVGDEASKFALAADVLFLGSAIVSKRGREIEFIGPASGDPLVGLRLSLAPEVEAIAPSDPPQSLEAASVNFPQQRSEPRVRVFRASADV